MDDSANDVLVLRRRAACPVPQNLVGKPSGNDRVAKDQYKKQEEKYEQEKQDHGVNAGGYLIGRHRECGMFFSQQCV
jgi:serine/threonine-protein kinase Chk2